MRGEVYPHAARWIVLWGVLFALSFFVGCAPSAALQRVVETETAAHDADLAEWETLTPRQRKESVKLSRAAWYEVRRSLFGTPVPGDLK